ncbi:MAG: hypothetical protein IJ109_03615 [Firmicutes bacterium]|nr:hypothetical protein [Bacillota bacterium]
MEDRKHMVFFIIYLFVGIGGLMMYVYGAHSNMILYGSLLLLMAAVVHFKHMKDEIVEYWKKQ